MQHRMTGRAAVSVASVCVTVASAALDVAEAALRSVGAWRGVEEVTEYHTFDGGVVGHRQMVMVTGVVPCETAADRFEAMWWEG